MLSGASMFTTCSHTHESGATCKSPAIRGTALCYHHTPRETIRRSPRRSSQSFELPVLESRNSILIATSEVLQRLAEGRIKRTEADTLLRALKMAARMVTELENEPIGDEMFGNPYQSADDCFELGPRESLKIDPDPDRSRSRTEKLSIRT